ncbi:SH3 domain-containing protein [Pseudoduganella sp.]|uniref:SH3 domain-containing protein n=1 Tax=Pseudoduganella sp. TaxID=1880898 RepID=UPI0035B3E9D5
MDLPRDQFEHIRKLTEQYSAAERALLQAQAVDPYFQLRKSMGAAVFDAIFERNHSPLAKAYERVQKQINEAQRITDQLRIYDQVDRRATNLDHLGASEWRWIEAVRKAVTPINPWSDLAGAATSTSALQKYQAFHLDGSLGILAQALAESTRLERATDQWSSIERILSTVQALQDERDHWALNGGESFQSELGGAGSEIIAAVVPHEADASLSELAGLLDAILQEVRSNKSDPHQAAIFWTRVFPCLFALLLFALTPIWDTYVKRAIERFDPIPATQPAREANRSVSLQAREFKLTPMLLSELRFVDCHKKGLELRTTPRKSAPALPMMIPRGQPVQVLEMKDSWTKIRWTDSEQSFVVEGWVFTRYLKKFT